MIAEVLVMLGIGFLAVSVLGLFRFPDVFTRAQALGVGDTLGVLLVVLGLAVHHGWSWLSVKLLVLLALLFFVNPTVVHAVLRAAARCGLRPWTGRAK